jgi:hypothetical protein
MAQADDPDDPTAARGDDFQRGLQFLNALRELKTASALDEGIGTMSRDELQVTLRQAIWTYKAEQAKHGTITPEEFAHWQTH